MTGEYVYFARGMQCGKHAIKVGYSKNPRWRVRSLGSTKHVVTMITYVEGRVFDEMAIHELLSKSRIQYEWYRPSRRLHRILSYCLVRGTLPNSITEAGTHLDEMGKAKKALNLSLAGASNFLSDPENFGLTRDNDPFAPGLKLPDDGDFSWLDNIITASMTGARSA